MQVMFFHKQSDKKIVTRALGVSSDIKPSIISEHAGIRAQGVEYSGDVRYLSANTMAFELMAQCTRVISALHQRTRELYHKTSKAVNT